MNIICYLPLFYWIKISVLDKTIGILKYYLETNLRVYLLSLFYMSCQIVLLNDSSHNQSLTVKSCVSQTWCRDNILT